MEPRERGEDGRMWIDVWWYLVIPCCMLIVSALSCRLEVLVPPVLLPHMPHPHSIGHLAAPVGSDDVLD